MALSGSAGDAKRVRRDADNTIWFLTAYEELKKPADEEGFLSHPVDLSVELTGKPTSLLARASYARLYRQIRHGEATFVHVSGNPGTGTSCCMWYFVNRLLNDAEVTKCRIVVQLLEYRVTRYLVISPDGQVRCSTEAPWADLALEGTWLLVDQMFTGHRARRGTTVLFASPSPQNGAVEAGKLMDESLYETLYLDAWKPSELLKAFNRGYRGDLGAEVLTRTGYQARVVHPPRHFRCKVGSYSAAAHFLARMHVCGGIVRCFFEDLGAVMDRQVEAVTRFVETGGGSKSHEVFYSRPSYSLRKVDDTVLISPYVRKVYTAKAFAATGGEREKLSNLAKVDKKLASTAGEVFEEYAHLLLSLRGGTYEDIRDGSSSVTFKPRATNAFYGNRLHHEKDMYDLPLSKCFGIVDAASPEDGLLLQMSSRGLMWRLDFERLVGLCQAEMGAAGGAVIRGATAKQPVLVHVRPHDTGPVSEQGLKEPVWRPVMTAPRGSRKWRRAPLPIPQVTIRLPAMDKVSLAPVYEELAEMLDRMQEAVQRGVELFEEEEGLVVCEECGETDVEGEVSDEFFQCKQCTGWLHSKCLPRGGEGRCLTCCLLKVEAMEPGREEEDGGR